MKRLILSCALSAALLAPGHLVAQSLIDASDPAQIATIARGYGAVELTVDGVGDPMLQGRMDGNQYRVYFHGCNEGRDCTNIQFLAGWVNSGNMTHATMRSWNAENRFGKALLDADNDPVIQWDVNLFGGVSRANLDDTFDWWRLVMNAFAEYVQ
jgi:hypothetical protein